MVIGNRNNRINANKTYSKFKDTLENEKKNYFDYKLVKKKKKLNE